MGLRPRLRAARAAAFLLVAALSSSCWSPFGIHKYQMTVPEKGHLITAVPFEKWLDTNYCGPACLTMVLNYWGGSFSQRRIAAAVFDSESQGTYSSELMFYPRTLGFLSYSFQGDLQTLRDVVSLDIPLIVLTRPIMQLGRGHYRVVIGFDDARRQVIFHDPCFGARYAMSFKYFLELWELGSGLNRSRWAMAVVPGERAFPFPTLASHPLTAVNLGTAYYRRSAFEKSREEWLKAAERLTGDPYPLYSLGMINLKLGNAGEAESYAREALKLDGKNAFALDVLGLALAAQGKFPEALEALRRSANLAPERTFIRDHYRQVKAIRDKQAGLEKKPKKQKPSASF